MWQTLISRETSARFIAELQKWNKKINLVAQKELNNIWERHIYDSMQLMQFIDDRDVHIADIGSGAGFPGVILSFCGVKEVTLIESDERKCAFLLNVAKLSDNKINIINDRVENLRSASFDILTSRAMASVNDILHYTMNIEVKEKYLLLKGKNYLKEINHASQLWNFALEVYNSASNYDGKILELKEIQKR